MLRIGNDLSLFFHKNVILAIDHDLGYLCIIQDFLQYIQLADGIVEFPAQQLHLFQPQIIRLGCLYHRLIDEIQYFFIRHLSGKIDPFQDGIVNSLSDLLIGFHTVRPPSVFGCNPPDPRGSDSLIWREAP